MFHISLCLNQQASKPPFTSHWKFYWKICRGAKEQRRAWTESKENGVYLLKWPFPHSRFGHFQCPKRKSKTTFYTNIPLISGNYGLRDHFWPLESRFLMRKSEKKGPNFLGFWILKSTYSESSHQIRQLG